jgi:hypothetical protein
MRDITARDIAWWAESVDGMPNQKLEVVAEQVGTETRYVVKPAGSGGTTILTGIQSPSTAPPLKPCTVVVKVNVGGKTKEIELTAANGMPADALFWGNPSAIEKFFYSYYHAQRLLDDQQWASMKATLAKGNIVAVAHFPPSHGIAITDQGDTLVISEQRES